MFAHCALSFALPGPARCAENCAAGKAASLTRPVLQRVCRITPAPFQISAASFRRARRGRNVSSPRGAPSTCSRGCVCVAGEWETGDSELSPQTERARSVGSMGAAAAVGRAAWLRSENRWKGGDMAGRRRPEGRLRGVTRGPSVGVRSTPPARASTRSLPVVPGRPSIPPAFPSSAAGVWPPRGPVHAGRAHLSSCADSSDFPPAVRSSGRPGLLYGPSRRSEGRFEALLPAFRPADLA
jgi:hypothetical protein